jgi:hypothetical protein
MAVMTKIEAAVTEAKKTADGESNVVMLPDKDHANG